MFTKKNVTRPFEDQSSMEFLCERNDTSLFAYGAHSKKRPHNIVLGRMFDFQLLEMIELGINKSTFKPISAFSARTATVRLGGKPMILFQGELFESNSDYQLLKSLFLDFYRGETLEKINLASVDRVLILTAHGGKVFLRQYAIMMKKSGTRFPRIELEEIGPHVDMDVRRVKPASAELKKQAMRQAKQGVPRKVKNIEPGILGEKRGRLHLEHQDLDQMALKKMKGLGKKKRKTKIETTPEGEGEAVGEERANGGDGSDGESGTREEMGIEGE